METLRATIIVEKARITFVNVFLERGSTVYLVQFILVRVSFVSFRFVSFILQLPRSGSL